MRGLVSKVENAAFVKYIESFDIVCLTETHVKSDYTLSCFPDFDIFVADAHKLSKQGRLACGVMVLVKKQFSNLVHRINIDVENTVVLKLDKTLLKSELDIVLVAYYAPPYDSSFWKLSNNGFGLETLENCILNIHESNINDFHMLICGDFNARTGTQNSKIFDDLDVLSDVEGDYPRSSQDSSVINAFGEQLIEICNMSESIILNGLSEFNFDDSCTFVSSSGTSLVDYFIMSKALFVSLQIDSLYVDNKIESDHLPVVLSLKMETQDNAHVENKDKGYVNKVIWDKSKEDAFLRCLHSPPIQEKIVEATNLLQSDIEKALDCFTNSLITASDCMVRQVNTHKMFKKKSSDWYDEECKQAKKDVKGKLKIFRRTRLETDRKEYTSANKAFKVLTRAKKQASKRQRADTLADSSKNPSEFWTQVRNMLNDRKPDNSDSIDIDTWFHHFQQLFGDLEVNNDDINLNDEHNGPNNLNSVITAEEVIKAIKKLKTGKSGGLDRVLSEMLKAGKNITVAFLTDLFNAIFDRGQYPSQWAKAIIVPIHKKGDFQNPNNYRGISLLSILSKCFTSILNQRLYSWLEDEHMIVENQAGFRKNYSTTDHIFTLHALVQSSLSKRGKKLYVAFVDFTKAFDYVDHTKLLETLQKDGISGKFYCILRSMYESLKSCVRVKGEFSEFFDCPRGVRQGCVLSPTLFSLFINQLAQHINESGRHGIQLLPGLMELFILLFADDVTLISSTPFGLQNQLNCLKQSCVQLKLEVNIEKTKIIVFRKGGFLGKNEQWYFNGRKLEVVNEYCYLGFVFTTMLSYNIGTNHLVNKGKRAVFNLCRLFQQLKEMSKDAYFKIFDSKVQSILLYSSEIWGISRLESIEKVHLAACKHFLGVPSRTPNQMIYSELGRFPLFINSTIRSIKYWFRLLQMEDDRLPKQSYLMLFNLDQNGKHNWASNIRNTLSSAGFYFVWLHQGVGNTNTFLKILKSRLQDMFRQEWEATVRGKDRYSVFRSFKFDFKQEKYIVDIDVYCFRVALSQLRFGVLPINNNLHRYTENPDSKLCVFCKNCLEDEHHFLLVCPLYNDIRNRFLSIRPRSAHFLLMLTNPDKTRLLSKFVYHSIQRRKKYAEAIDAE